MKLKATERRYEKDVKEEKRGRRVSINISK